MEKKTKKNLQKYFKRGKLGWKLLWLTFIFSMLFVSIFAPFMLIESANKTLGIVLLSALGFIYIFLIFILIWDWLKEKVIENQNK